jgi:protocatechuate 3,4-dioxygenase beta subunit
MLRRRGSILLVAVVGLAVLVWSRLDSRYVTTLRTSKSTAHEPGRELLPRTQVEGGTESAAVVAPSAREGDLRLEGQVLDAAGQPVAGARVCITTSSTMETTSEVDGSFVFDGLAPRVYHVEARASAGVAGPISVRLSDATEPLTIRLSAGASARVRVLSAATSSPIADAHVQLRGLRVEEERTDASGVATFRQLTAGWHAARVRSEGHADHWLPASIPRQGEVDLVVMLDPGAEVRGKVQSADGKPLADVRLSPQYGGEALHLQDPVLDAATSNASGDFVLRGLREGTLTIIASHNGYGEASSEQLVATVGSVLYVTITLSPGRRVAGVVVGADGKPVAGAVVQALRSAEDGSTLREVRSATDGSFELNGLPRGRVAIVAHQDHSSSSIVRQDLGGGDVTGLSLKLDNAATIRGHVVDGTGVPVPEARVFATVATSRRISSTGLVVADVADQSGAFVLRGLMAAEYEVVALPPISRGLDELAAKSAGLRVAPGDSDVQLVLARMGAVRGRLRAPGGGNVPRHELLIDGVAASAMTDETGAFSIDDLPIGARVLEVRGAGFAAVAVRFEIRDGLTTDLGDIELPTGRRVGGRVLREDGLPAAGATVVIDTRLLGDGNSLTSAGLSLVTGARSTKADSSGRFSFSGVDIGAKQIAAETKEGRSETAIVTTSEKDAEVELVIKRVGSLSGMVRDHDGPVAGAMLLAQGRSKRGSATVTTGADGRYFFKALGPGETEVNVLVADGSGHRAIKGKVTVEPGREATLDIDIPGGSITLTVDVRGQSTERLTVMLAGHSGLGIQKALPGESVDFGSLSSGAYRLCIKERKRCQDVIVQVSPAQQQVALDTD